MSFVEKHKAWLLPVLALGVGGVVYLNLHTFSGEAKPEASTPPVATVPSATPTDSAPVETPGPPPVTTMPGAVAASGGSAPSNANDALWADLTRLAKVPAPMSQAEEFRALARKAVPAQPPTEGAMSMPGRVPEPRPLPKEGPAKAVEMAPANPPEVDFLIHTPKGSRAWFQGREYRLGQGVDPGTFKVRAIAPQSVELQGPHGTTRRSTLDLPASSPAPSEAP